MISHIITFLIGTYSGIALMCLFQINKKSIEETGMLPKIDFGNILAKRVQELCKERGLTYEKLSYQSDVSLNIILQIIDGSEKNIDIVTIVKICKGMDISLKKFFDIEEFKNLIT